MDVWNFVLATLVTLGASWFFGDYVKLRFYTKHRHIHHGLYGVILLPVGAFLDGTGLLLGIVWGLLLSEAEFFVTARIRKSLAKRMIRLKKKGRRGRTSHSTVRGGEQK